ncbi:DUF4174 domain-containing protein [Dokdonia sinensis]|uniref:DUF4174 domain-containing protein n=2 Tax=Dokdonia sinensis TaxID=2479847 RepID=A0A3M0G1V3_9FLAO|nr:DUF4174 domain-containing protein [Dokdonia sinensis]
MTMISQNLKSLQWKKRAIVVYAPSFDDEKAQSQAKKLKEVKSKFDDYKLVFIEHTNEGERTDFGEVKFVDITEEFKGFKVFLVGLDGGVKFESSTVQEPQRFFDLIDTMPMRRNEIKNE